ncbi:MAG TPA: hypothetical protein VGF47_07635 [Solirubrobacteraceae bacterium]
MFTARTRSLIGACAVLCGLAIPAAANAAGVYVSNSAPVVAGGKSCAQPSFSSIQGAISAASAQIVVCPGTYKEQLTITKTTKVTVAGTAGSAKVALPASPSNSDTPCDKAAAEAGFSPDQDEIAICGSIKVSINGLAVEAKWPSGTCGPSMYGIRVAGGALLSATNVTVEGAGASPINGCQSGVGIQAGTTRTKPAETGSLKLKGVTVSDYQKNGITIATKGSSANIATTTVIGAGATEATAQNGIQVSDGASIKLKSSKVSGDECENVNCSQSTTQAAGLLLLGAAPGSSVSSSTVSENDMGVYYLSESESQPAGPEVTLSKDNFSGNRYEGVILDQGDAVLKGDKITGPGKIGIDLLQYEEQSLSSQSSALSTRVEGMSEAAVKVESDKAATDKPGKFTVTKSTFNSDASVLVNESSNFEVIF